MKKTAVVLFSVLLLSLPFLIAANDTVPPDFQPVAGVLQGLLDRINVLVGGIFGLYLIFILFRIHHERQKVRLLKHILYNLDQLNKHYHLPIAKENKTFWWKLFHKNTVENGNFSAESAARPSSSQKSKK